MSRLCLALLCLLVAYPTRGAEHESLVPPDFKILARFGSGSIDPGNRAAAWRYTVSARGKATLEVYRFPDGKTHTKRTLSSIPQREVARMIAVAGQQNFFSLPSDMSGETTDSPSYILEITTGGRHHRVEVYAPFDVHEKKSLRRFRRVWEAVFRNVPEPDGGDAINHLRVNS